MTAPADGRYDVVIVSDLRFPGGTGSSIAEEVKAQAAAGYSTALVHVPGPVVSAHRGFHPAIARALRAGLADLGDGERALEARLLVLRHPGVFSQPLARIARVEAERNVLVVNQAPRDATMLAPHYDVDRVREIVGSTFGERFVWAPIGPLVRDSVLGERPDLPLTDGDWVNVVDVGEWVAERSPLEGRRPVIGRHSRPDFRKWPHTASDLLAAYPGDPDISVRILGSLAGARRRLHRSLRRVPKNWTVYPFGSVDPREFLAEVDFFVYFHHPGLVEAFGRAPLEALASGAVVILPEHFRRVFGDACLYTEAHGVRSLVERLAADPDAYAEQATLGRDRARERFSHEAHADRVGALIGEPSGAPLPTPARRPIARRVLFVSSNGGGMGHLTRLLATARRASAGVEPVFFTLSTAVSVVREQGFLCEFFASWEHRKLAGGEWDPLFSHRLSEIIRTYRPRAVVFDGTAPYAGILENAKRHPQIPFVWSRRGMWRSGAGKAFRIAQARSFDLVIEPGELAGAFDAGLTAQHRDQALTVDPVLLLRPDEALGHDEAARELGLDPEAPAALVSLGAGNIADVTDLRDGVVSALGAVEGLQVCVTDPVIAEQSSESSRGRIRSISVHPLSRYLAAFDFAVAASGYNSFHELMAARVPSIFVPNRDTALDDQEARARFAEQAGAGACVVSAGPELHDALRPFLDVEARRRMQERAGELARGDGAAQAMRAVEALL